MLYQELYCHECKRETGHYNGKCGICLGKKADKEKREHFARLKGLTLEERIEELEKWQYELMINPPWIEPRY